MIGNMNIFFLIFIVLNIFVFLKALYETRRKNNAFGLTRWLTPLGSFVWGDAVVLSVFWIVASLVSWWLSDWNVFWLIASVFWVVRGAGETIYWLNEQFARDHRNPPESLWGYSLFKSEAIWFVYQLVWQCVTVAAVIASVYFGGQWLEAL